MLTKNIIWTTALALFLLAALSVFMPFGQAIRMAAILYFMLYLPGYFFLKNIYKSESMIEQNTLSLILGIVLQSEIAYVLYAFTIPYYRTTAVMCAAAIIGASLLLEQARQRKTRGASKRRK